MRGDFYIQLTRKGVKVEKPKKMDGTISVQNKKLTCFGDNHCFMLEMDVLDFMISADGILFKGIEYLNGRRLYQEVWFVPKVDI